MGKRTLLNLWLAAALVVLVWVVWQEPGHDTSPATIKLTRLNPATITKVVITRGNQSLVLTRHDSTWELQQPIKITANASRVENLLHLAEAESLARFSAAGRDLVQYGLRDPEVRLRLDDTELLIGSATPLDQRRYVQVGDTIHLIADSFTYDLTSDAADYVSRDLLPRGAKIVAIDLPGGKLSRDEKGAWTLTPAASGIAPDVLQKLVDEWINAQAIRVATYDRRPAQGTVNIVLEGEPQPLHYAIVTRQPELILARPDLGVQYSLVAEQAERLLSPPAGTR